MKKTEILTVSYASFAFCLTSIFLLVVVAIISKLGSDGLIELLLGTETSANILNASKHDIGSSVEAILANEWLGRTVVMGLWMFVGLLVITAISVFQTGAHDIKEIEEELDSENIDKKRLLSEIGRDVVFRIFVSLTWVGWMYVTLQLVIPYLMSAVFVIAGSPKEWDNWLYFAVGIVAAYAVFHVHVVFARLFVGKVRLFGL